MKNIKRIFDSILTAIKTARTTVDTIIAKLIAAGDTLNMYVSYSNKKLIPNKTVKFLIWNIPAIATCPYATLACINNCYARKSEIAYKNCLPCRSRNLYISKQDSFVDRMISVIDYNMNSRPTYKNAKRVYFRIHESGDFYSYEYFVKWMNIINYAKKYKNLYFVAYTKSIPFIDTYIKNGNKIPDNISIVSSIWSDTKQKYIDLTNKLNLPVYTADTEINVNNMVKAGNAFKCECKDCASCTACFHKKYKKIACVIH